MSITLREMRETFASRLAGYLDSGNVLWHDRRLPPCMPRSLVSAKNYCGVNSIILMLAAIEKSYDDPRWVPYRESLYIKHGETGVFLEWWDKKKKNEIQFRSILCFNAQQLFHYPAAEGKGFEANVASARRILKRFEIPSPLPVENDLDEVEGTYFDEYDASTGTVSLFRRKDWCSALKAALKNLVETEGVTWGCSKEKHLSLLRFDLGVSFLTLSLGMGVSELDQAMPYQLWAEAIRKNPSEIARATKDAQQIANKILGSGRHVQ
jgi:hypothetical protein